MTPDPERVGSGITNIDAEKQLLGVKEEINTIIKSAINGVTSDQKIKLTGLVAERELVETEGIKNYFHPTISIINPTSEFFDDEKYNDFALGGKNFSNLFSFDLESKSVDWGGDVGMYKYEPIYVDDPDPLKYFFSTIDARVYYDFIELEETLNDSGLNRQIELLENGDIAYFLLPKTIDVKSKLDMAQLILTGLKNAGGLK